MRTAALLCFTALLTALSGCKPAEPAAPYAPTSTMRELMQSIVDPSADFMWDSFAIIITAKGEEHKMPRTDEEWAQVRYRGVALVEATNLLLIPGRHVARPDEKADNPEFERDPQVIETMIAQDRATFVKHITDLRQAAQNILAAVDARDLIAIDDTSEALDKACEDCHMTYWYVPDK